MELGEGEKESGTRLLRSMRSFLSRTEESDSRAGDLKGVWGAFMNLLERLAKVVEGDLVGGGDSDGSSSRMCEVDEKRRVEEDGEGRLRRHRQQREVGVNRRVSRVFIVWVD